MCVEVMRQNDLHIWDNQGISNDEIAPEMSGKEVVQEWLEAQVKTFYSAVIRRLVYCWSKWIEEQGNYMEKLLCDYFVKGYNKIAFSFSLTIIYSAIRITTLL
jgi:hypothetical protein